MKKAFDLNDYIEDIELNGLQGRMINAPTTNPKAKKLNILLFHGHHSSLERMGGVAELLLDYGNFCMPDFPGFGGMDPLYKIGLMPDYDNLADYMAAFIKLHYGTKKKFVVVGYSFGFVVLGRMLQKYPELKNQVIEVVGIASFVSGESFVFSKNRLRIYTAMALIGQTRLGSFVIRELFLRKWFIGTIYVRTRNAKVKFAKYSKVEVDKYIDFEVHLWRCNDLRTHAYTILEMFRVNLLNNDQKIDTNVISIVVDGDHYFDNKTVEQHLNVLFDKVKVYRAKVDVHGMSIIADAKDAEMYFPKQVRAHLRSLL